MITMMMMRETHWSTKVRQDACNYPPVGIDERRHVLKALARLPEWPGLARRASLLHPPTHAQPSASCPGLWGAPPSAQVTLPCARRLHGPLRRMLLTLLKLKTNLSRESLPNVEVAILTVSKGTAQGHRAQRGVVRPSPPSSPELFRLPRLTPAPPDSPPTPPAPRTCPATSRLCEFDPSRDLT